VTAKRKFCESQSLHADRIKISAADFPSERPAIDKHKV
jgi:hypothetical protein